MILQLLDSIEAKTDQLRNHSIYSKLETISELRFFMERHVFAVFDFMCLAKSLQHKFAPAKGYWTPPSNPQMARFINEIILAEESDFLFGDPEKPMSHFEIYIEAMKEVGANTAPILSFLAKMKDNKYDLSSSLIPLSCKRFIAETFSVIQRNQINEIAAYFCFGRERIIPDLFQAILEKSNIRKSTAPIFEFYLKRHIEIDGDEHGPIALKMIEDVCQDDPTVWFATTEAANRAILHRINFWNDISEELNAARHKELSL